MTNAIKLKGSGDHTDMVGWACSTCRSFRVDKITADLCCKKTCVQCDTGEKVHGHTTCMDCLSMNRVRREAERWAKLRKVHVGNYDGEYVCMDGHEHEVTEIADWIDEAAGDVDVERWAWAVEPTTLPRLDAIDVMDGMLSDLHEDAIDSLDMAGLQKLLDQWVAEQDVRGWWQAASYVVVLDMVG